MPVSKVDTNLYERFVCQMGRCEDPCIVACCTLWHKLVRRYSLLRYGEGGPRYSDLIPISAVCLNSLKIYRTPSPYTGEQLTAAVLETIRANKMKACYIRPVVYRGYGDVGVNPHGVSC